MHSLARYMARTARVSRTLCAFALCACSGSLGVPDGPDRPSASGASAPSAAQGAIGGTTAGTGTGTSPAGGGAAMSAPPNAALPARCVTKAVGPAPLRRLTHREYENAVRDLLGDEAKPESAFAADTQKDLFDTMATQSVSVLLADQYLDAATQLAESSSDLKGLLGCDPASASASCLRAFVKRFGRRAYRRPVSDDELERLTALFEATRVAADAPTGARAVLAALLASPHFLFRPEFGGEASPLANARKTSPYELAARLSFLLWSSVPDDTLLDAAESGALANKEQIGAQARRMLDDPRAQRGVLGFYEQWLGLALLDTTSKDSHVYPAFDDTLRGAMLEETRRFVAHVLFEADAKLRTLLTAPYGFVNAQLAKLYGVKGPSDASTFSKVDLDPAQRSGLLTQASIMTTYAASEGSSPVKRGKWVRVRMLCHDLPEPPANVPPLPATKQGVSTRERFAMHTDNPACSGCHRLIDGLGFGLERYDGIGAYRSMELGVNVDARGEVTHTLDIDGPYEGGPALARLLAQSEQVQSCAPTQWFRYGLGRREGVDDACSLADLQETFQARDGDMKQLMVLLTQTDAFDHYRKPD